MRHVPEGTLRRLVDEPLAVTDAESVHAASCSRCAARRERVVRDAQCARSLLSRPQAAPDVDAGWARLQAVVPPVATAAPARRRPHLRARRRRPLFPLAMPAPVALATAAVLLVGATAGVTLAVLSPTTSSPSPSPASVVDFQAVADIAGVAGGGTGVLGGLATSSGTLQLPFGVLRWTSSGHGHAVASLAAAEQATGLPLRSVADLPAGVGGASKVYVQPSVTATIVLGAAAGPGLAGRSLTVTAGPAVLVEYRAAAGLGAGDGIDIPTLATLTMPRPSASSSSGSPASDELEAYVLSQPGLPDGLVQEIRLIGNLAQILPLRAAEGAKVSEVQVDGSPAILVSDGSDIASGVIWVDHAGVVHAALGLLDQEDILDVANQLG